MSGRLVLAVDGGNSKTDLALLREDGAVLALVRGGNSSPHHLGLDGDDRAARASCTRTRAPAPGSTATRAPRSATCCWPGSTCRSRSERLHAAVDGAAGPSA